ncbi:(2Fe-2S)-binding protein [Kribbella sp. CA-247076]|uniref:(2Fe-2S)-binding protein n=1 Tax=Kribbella sp. CA-247076 TaxID=3239941 RepID=UPI003D8A034F
MEYDARRLAAIVEDAVEWVDVRVADGVPGPEWVACADVVAGQRAGGDPTYEWRRTLRENYGREYGVEPPAQIAAMITLMWYVQVPSIVAGVTGAVTGRCPDVSASSLAFRLHPTAHYPVEVALLTDRVVTVGEAAEQLDEHTRAFLTTYRPEVKLGSLQRFGVVKDELRQAIRMPVEAPYADEAAAAFDVSLDEKFRISCCYFYALPNIKACSTCPRFR